MRMTLDSKSNEITNGFRGSFIGHLAGRVIATKDGKDFEINQVWRMQRFAGAEEPLAQAHGCSGI